MGGKGDGAAALWGAGWVDASVLMTRSTARARCRTRRGARSPRPAPLVAGAAADAGRRGCGGVRVGLTRWGRAAKGRTAAPLLLNCLLPREANSLADESGVEEYFVRCG